MEAVFARNVKLVRFSLPNSHLCFDKGDEVRKQWYPWLWIAVSPEFQTDEIKFITRCRVTNDLIFTTRKHSLRRLCFYRCLSVHGGGGSYPSMHCRWYPSMPCSRSWGVLARIWSRPTAKGEVEGDLVQDHTQGGSWGGSAWGCLVWGGCLVQGGAWSHGEGGGAWSLRGAWWTSVDGYCCRQSHAIELQWIDFHIFMQCQFA